MRRMPCTISRGTPIISCRRALNPSCSSLPGHRRGPAGGQPALSPGCPQCPPRQDLPHVHEHVGEEAPGARPVPGVIDQGALHVLRVVGLQHPLVQPGPIAQEHDDLWQTPWLSPSSPLI